MNRTGTHPSKAPLLFEAVKLLPAVKVIGLHVYDGNIRDTDPSLRKQNVDLSYGNVVVVAEAIEVVNNVKLMIVAGGSPSLPVHAKRPGTECSPGTFIFWDHGYKHTFPDEPFNLCGAGTYKNNFHYR